MENNLTNNQKIGNRIKEIRTTKFPEKLTQTEFAELFTPPLNRSAVKNWESGLNLPNNKRLRQIAEIGKVSLDYLLLGKTDNEENQVIEKESKGKGINEESVLDNVAIGKRIKEIRLNLSDKKTTLENFGKMLDLQADKAVVNKWEKGVNLPNKERLKQIAEIGNVSIEYLYFGINTKKVTEIIREIENNPVSNVGYFITQEQINELKKSINYIE